MSHPSFRKCASVSTVLVALVLAAAPAGNAASSPASSESSPLEYFSAADCTTDFCTQCIAAAIAYCAIHGGHAAWWDCGADVNGYCHCRGGCNMTSARLEAIR